MRPHAVGVTVKMQGFEKLPRQGRATSSGKVLGNRVSHFVPWEAFVPRDIPVRWETFVRWVVTPEGARLTITCVMTAAASKSLDRDTKER